MSRSPCCPERGLSLFFRASLAVLAWCSAAQPASASGDPIARIARVISNDLVRIESRIDWLERRLGTLASPRECRLGNGFGFRGGRPDPNAPAPWVQVDLGRQESLDRLFLIPAQPEFGSSTELFPRRFLLQVSNDPGFAKFDTLMDQTTGLFPQPKGRPLAIHGRATRARFVRLTVIEGTDLGCSDAFALSELLVVSEGTPVSIGAKVSCSWSDSVSEAWEARFLTDGRTPLGPWEGGTWSPSRGILVPSEECPPYEPLEIVIDLGRELPVERIHLVPLECSRMPGIGVLPHNYLVGLTPEDSDEIQVIHHQKDPSQRGTELAPRIIPAAGINARYLRLRCFEPWSYGNRHAYGLAEIEIYSDGVNVAAGSNICAWQGGYSLDQDLSPLIDGYSSRRRSLPVDAWMAQLSERARIERELNQLRPLRRKISSETELHATWMTAMALGLGFLIPVAIIERRRFMSREQVDVLRRRIASDLHDDIGSNLGSISMIARAVRRDIKSTPGADRALEDLEELESVAHESAIAMRDIVWLIERKHDTIGDLVNRLRETASRLLRELDYDIECDCVSGTSRLCLDAKRHLFLFCKEAMHNVAKHAGARHFILRIEDEEGWLRIEASDDGRGLGDADSSRKATLQKLRERARVLAGVLDIGSTEDQGTVVVLRVPRAVLQSRIPI